MKNVVTKLLSLALIFTLCFSLTACFNKDKGNDDNPDGILGITEDTIWVGNTAATTGEMAKIGEPFNIGIRAAFAAYNNAGGFKGKKIQLKHYDDGSSSDNSTPLLDKLINEDEVFAIVGQFGSYSVDTAIETLKDEKVPMIYAAAGNDSLLNENATSAGDKCIFPVQPLNQTEGRILALRAFAPTDKGGLGAKKVGVISTTSNDASKAILAGIKAEAKDSNLNIFYHEVASSDYTAAVNALKEEGCEAVIITAIGTEFVSILNTMANAQYKCNVLTSYNNADAGLFNNGNVLNAQYEAIFACVNVFAQSWLDTTSETFVYNRDTALNKEYAALSAAFGLTYNGQAGFTEAYWDVAEDIYNYVITVDKDKAFAMSYNSYALAGYIAGDLFVQAMKALEKSGKALSRANLVEVMESQQFNIAMADKISFMNGMRAGVQSFGLTCIFDVYNVDPSLGGGKQHAAQMSTVYPLTSIEEYRAILAGK